MCCHIMISSSHVLTNKITPSLRSIAGVPPPPNLAQSDLESRLGIPKIWMNGPCLILIKYHNRYINVQGHQIHQIYYGWKLELLSINSIDIFMHLVIHNYLASIQLSEWPRRDRITNRRRYRRSHLPEVNPRRNDITNAHRTSKIFL